MRLCINIDHVATLRNARGGPYPDIIAAALTVERAGADGIVCHLREDRRHIRDADVERLREAITTKLDLEMAIAEDIIKVALRVKPDLVTLVPERRRELTTEGGLDVVRHSGRLKRAIGRFHDQGILVSTFIDPVQRQIEAAIAAGTDLIELHTGEYADARTQSGRRGVLGHLRRMASFAHAQGLGVNAGHGLDYTNIGPIRAIPAIEEVSIGYAVVVRALSVGLEQAVREMVRLVKKRPQ